MTMLITQLPLTSRQNIKNKKEYIDIVNKTNENFVLFQKKISRQPAGSIFTQKLQTKSTSAVFYITRMTVSE